MKKRIMLVFVVLSVFLLSGCIPERPVVDYTDESASSAHNTPAVPTPNPTPEPTPVPTDHDYGRDRALLGEYVYLIGDTFHEIECPHIYADCEGMLFETAKKREYQACSDCENMGDNPRPSFYYNQDFERSMNVKYKINLRDTNGDYDMVFVTTGDDEFDINNLLINDRIRNWYKEFGIDPDIIRVFVRDGNRTYHNTFCDDVVNVEKKTSFTLSEAYAGKYTACKKCQPPTATWNTLPVKTPDQAHFYYASTTFIRRARNEDRYVVDESLNIDMERIRDGYYDQ